MTARRATGRGWAYVGTILGGAVSLAANVAHSYIPPTHAPAGWTPETGAVLSAMFWPFAVFVAVEILVRVGWPTGRRWLTARFLGLLPVALVAAVVSYRHLSGLLAHYGEDRLTVMIGPVAVDGLMVMATAALIATSTRYTRDPGEPTDTTPTAVRRQGGLDAQPTPPAVTVPTPQRANGHVIGSGVAR